MKFAMLFRRAILLAFSLVAILTGAGCVPVSSKKIIGTVPPKNIQSYEGTWNVDAAFNSDGSAGDKDVEMIRVRVADRNAGRLAVTGMDKDKKPQTLEMFVRTVGGHDFLSVKDPGPTGNEFTLMLIVAHGKNTIVVVGPKAETIARLVDAKQLRGSTEYRGDKQLKSVTLDDLSDDEAKKLFLPENMASFHWEHPLVYVRKGR